MRRVALSLAVALVLSGAVPVNGSVIETVSSWDGFFHVNSASGRFSSSGQTFTVVWPDIFLDSFTFFVNDRWPGGRPINFAAYVMQWEGSKAVGPVLFPSVPHSTTNNGVLDGFEEFRIDTGGTQLTAGKQYIAFFSTLGFERPSYGDRTGRIHSVRRHTSPVF
jgi:hypothetical protein